MSSKLWIFYKERKGKWLLTTHHTIMDAYLTNEVSLSPDLGANKTLHWLELCRKIRVIVLRLTRKKMMAIE